MGRIPDPPRDRSWLWIANGKICFPFQTSSLVLNLGPHSQPIIAVQNAVAPAQIPLAMSLVIFSQSFAGALFLSFSDTIFSNSLKTLIPIYAPSVSAQTIIDAGATGFQNEVSGANLAGVLIAYAKSIDRVFYLTAGMGVGCFVFAWGMGWKDIRKKDDGLKA